MDRKLTKQETTERLRRAGFYVSEQRGFYSHFLRVRAGEPSPENETLITLDIADDDTVSLPRDMPAAVRSVLII